MFGMYVLQSNIFLVLCIIIIIACCNISTILAEKRESSSNRNKFDPFDDDDDDRGIMLPPPMFIPPPSLLLNQNLFKHSKHFYPREKNRQFPNLNNFENVAAMMGESAAKMALRKQRRSYDTNDNTFSEKFEKNIVSSGDNNDEGSEDFFSSTSSSSSSSSNNNNNNNNQKKHHQLIQEKEVDHLSKSMWRKKIKENIYELKMDLDKGISGNHISIHVNKQMDLIIRAKKKTTEINEEITKSIPLPRPATPADIHANFKADGKLTLTLSIKNNIRGKSGKNEKRKKGEEGDIYQTAEHIIESLVGKKKKK